MSSTALMLDETVERLLSRHFATAVRGSAESSSTLLAEAIEAGLDLVFVPEDGGGLGAGLLEGAAVSYRWGYHAAPLPIVEMLLLRELKGLGLLADDENAALAVLPTGLNIEQPVLATAVDGEPSVIVVGYAGSGGRLSLAGFAPGNAVQRRSMAGEPLFILETRSVTPLWARETYLGAAELAAKGALLTATAILGMTQRLLEVAIEHVNTRKQFGKPLAKFQAIQHQLAEAAAEHVVAQAATRSAISAYDAGKLKDLSWQSAKMQAGKAGTVVASVTHQVLGAIGFTEEHLLHHYSKRLWHLRDHWGREVELRKAIGSAAAENSDRLWAWMVD